MIYNLQEQTKTATKTATNNHNSSREMAKRTKKKKAVHDDDDLESQKSMNENRKQWCVLKIIAYLNYLIVIIILYSLKWNYHFKSIQHTYREIQNTKKQKIYIKIYDKKYKKKCLYTLQKKHNK